MGWKMYIFFLIAHFFSPIFFCSCFMTLKARQLIYRYMVWFLLSGLALLMAKGKNNLNVILHKTLKAGRQAFRGKGLLYQKRTIRNVMALCHLAIHHQGKDLIKEGSKQFYIVLFFCLKRHVDSTMCHFFIVFGAPSKISKRFLGSFLKREHT